MIGAWVLGRSGALLAGLSRRLLCSPRALKMPLSPEKCSCVWVSGKKFVNELNHGEFVCLRVFVFVFVCAGAGVRLGEVHTLLPLQLLTSVWRICMSSGSILSLKMMPVGSSSDGTPGGS